MNDKELGGLFAFNNSLVLDNVSNASVNCDKKEINSSNFLMRKSTNSKSINSVHSNELKDYYWAYCDILRDIGINESTYDQRIMAFMALKLLIDSDKLLFNLEYRNKFGLSKEIYIKYRGLDTKETFLNIIKDIENLGRVENLYYFEQDSRYNPDRSKNILTYINHYKTFELERYIIELPNKHLENVLDIYTNMANFRYYPKEEYKDLYEKTISRMKKLSGDLTGQHFTQKSIIHLICEVGKNYVRDNETITIYDPTSGTGSMLMESADYFMKHTKANNIELYGQELHGQAWLLSKIFLEIVGYKNIIAYGNTLTNPAFGKGINGDGFDFIIANPPFGIDWKHNYKEIEDNLNGSNSNFFVVKDKKGKVVTPKKSDGQFLFMMHIINLMKQKSKQGGRAVAGIITSSTLISTGSNRSSEAIIREAIFQEGLVSAVLEQPNAMFTNTDISSHIWFLDTLPTDRLKIVKADNQIEPLFVNHPNPKDKMKNAYSEGNIEKLKRYIIDKEDIPFISKTLDCNRCEINISQEIGFKDDTEDLSIDALVEELDDLMKDMFEDYQNNGVFGL